MKSYKIKTLQFQILPVLLDTTQAEMSARMGVKPNYVCRKLKDCKFEIRDVLAICNAYHIPFSLFISVDSMDVYGGKLINGFEAWEPIAFRPSFVEKRLKKDGVSLNKVSDTLGIARNTVDTIFDDDCPLSRFVDFCNAFGFNMGEFITDPTLPRIADEKKELRKEVDRLRAELQEARAAAFVAEKELQELKVQKAALELQLMNRDNNYGLQVAED